MEKLFRECIGFRMGSAYRRVNRLFNRAFARLDLAHAHGHVLACLFVGGEMRIAELASKTGFDPSTVSRLVKELARRKLVRRRRDPVDGRAFLLRPATRAKKLRGEIEDIVRRTDSRVRKDLTQEDLQGLLNAAEILDRLA